MIYDFADFKNYPLREIQCKVQTHAKLAVEGDEEDDFDIRL